jgi:hypothetical protein
LSVDSAAWAAYECRSVKSHTRVSWDFFFFLVARES